MFQDSQLYAISIMHNILMRPLVNKEKDEKIVNDSLEKVGMLEKIQKLPLGIYTSYSQELDENGISFSGGEIQKILLARSFANAKSVNIYDEVTTSMDKESKLEIMKAIKKQAKNSIVIVVDHSEIIDDENVEIIQL